jgi:hypothetical protein
MENYKNKYIKYKNKYINLKNQIWSSNIITFDKPDIITFDKPNIKTIDNYAFSNNKLTKLRFFIYYNSTPLSSTNNFVFVIVLYLFL